VRGKTWDALRSFYGWWGAHGGPPFPLPDMPRPKPSRAQRRPLTDSQLEAVLRGVQGAIVTHPKAAAMVYCMLLAGARPSDVVALLVEDVDATPGRERIRFRDRKSDGSDEWHAVSPTLVDVVNLYLEQHPHPGGYLFTGRNGRMTTQAVDMAWRRLFGMAPEAMPSQARRWFANRLRKDGVDFEIIRKLMGHAQVTTTQIYLNSDEAEERRGVVDLGAYISRKEASLVSPTGGLG
jgi:integrase